MPNRHAYRLLGNETTKETLASHFFVIQSDKHEFDHIQKAMRSAADDEYNMELLTSLERETATVLPHWLYTMMSSEFRDKSFLVSWPRY